jgi:hypothetical protein
MNKTHECLLYFFVNDKFDLICQSSQLVKIQCLRHKGIERKRVNPKTEPSSSQLALGIGHWVLSSKL